MTDKIDISPEAVERLASHIRKTCACALGANAEQPVAGTLRALSARLAEVEAANRGLVRLNEATDTRAQTAQAKLGKAMEALRAVERLETTSANGTVRNMAQRRAPLWPILALAFTAATLMMIGLIG